MKKRYLIPIIILILGIVFIIVGALLTVNGIGVSDLKTDDFKKTMAVTDDLKTIDVSCDVGQLIIQKGDKFEVNCDDIVEKNFDIDYSKGVLTIEYKSEKWLKYVQVGTITDNVKKGEIKVTIPCESLENLELESGVGKVSLENLSVKSSNLKLGVGDTHIDGCEFTDNITISSGVGKLKADNSKFTTFDLESGIGDSTFKNCKIVGETSIEGGIGNIDMELIGSPDDYKFKLTDGLGRIVICGEKFWGGGDVYLGNSLEGQISSSIQIFRIENGIGEVRIDFTGF